MELFARVGTRQNSLGFTKSSDKLEVNESPKLGKILQQQNSTGVFLTGSRAVFRTVAIVGATGAVGRIILQLLEERKFPAQQFRLFASAQCRPAGLFRRSNHHD